MNFGEVKKKLKFCTTNKEKNLKTISRVDDYFEKGNKDGLLSRRDLNQDITVIRRSNADNESLKDIINWDFSNKTRYLRRLIFTSFFLVSLAAINALYGDGTSLYGVDILPSSVRPLNIFLIIWIGGNCLLYILSYLKDLWSRRAFVGLVESNLECVGKIRKKWQRDMLTRGVRIDYIDLFVPSNRSAPSGRELLDSLKAEEVYRSKVKRVGTISKILMFLDFVIPVILVFFTT